MLLGDRARHRNLRSVHDAVLICAPLEWLEDDIAQMCAAMTEASRIVLGGFELRSEVKRILPPDRFRDKRGAMMWDRVIGLISKRQLTAFAA